jgi:hypothetical protein
MVGERVDTRDRADVAGVKGEMRRPGTRFLFRDIGKSAVAWPLRGQRLARAFRVVTSASLSTLSFRTDRSPGQCLASIWSAHVAVVGPFLAHNHFADSSKSILLCLATTLK